MLDIIPLATMICDISFVPKDISPLWNHIFTTMIAWGIQYSRPSIPYGHYPFFINYVMGGLHSSSWVTYLTSYPINQNQLPFLASLEFPYLDKITNDPIRNDPWWPPMPIKSPSNIPTCDGTRDIYFLSLWIKALLEYWLH